MVAHVEAHVGISPDVRPLMLSVLGWIGACLSAGPRELVADELPGSLALAVRRAEGRPLALDGHDREIAAGVCRVLAEELSTEARALVRAALPAALLPLFVAGAEEGRDDSRAVPVHSSLAEGRPGSTRPLSEPRRR